MERIPSKDYGKNKAEKFKDENEVYLPSELSRLVSADSIQKNVKNYPEMIRDLTEIQKERVDKIKNILTKIPLIHTSSNEQIAKGVSDIIPLDELPNDHRGHSYKSDRSLGLTKYVFLNWGMSDRGHCYGKFVSKFSTNLLDDERTIVTPMDIGQIVLADEYSFDELELEKKQRIEDYYFKYIVSGKAWKEIIARRVLKELEAGKHFFLLNSSYSLGEIKHYGSVDAKNFIGSFPVSDLRENFRFLYEHGFAFDNVETEGVENRKRIYEQCKIDYKKASGFWKNKLKL